MCTGQKRGSLTGPGPSPVDRGKPGSKIHALSDRAGLPLAVAVSAANTNDSYALKPLVMAIPAIKSRRGPRRRKPDKLHAESKDKLGKHRWVIERTMAWFTGYRRLTLRYERKAEHFLAFLILGASLTCHKKLRKLTT